MATANRSAFAQARGRSTVDRKTIGRGFTMTVEGPGGTEERPSAEAALHRAAHAPSRGLAGASGRPGGAVASVVRWGWYSIVVNLVLIGLHGMIAAASGSLAVTAELIHNFVDLASAAVVVIGLKLAMHKAKTFPYGLYKIENLVAAGLAVMIFFTAYEVVRNVFTGVTPPPSVDLWMLVALILTAAIPLVFSHFELRVARMANSPALMADAREYRVHAYTTGLAFAALLTAWFDLPFDRIAALIIVAAVAKTGWDLLADALRVLLDASLDAGSLAEIRKVVETDPAVAEVKWVVGRNAGRFRFVEAGVALRLVELGKAEAAVRRIERTVQSAMPQIERVLLHVEARTSTHRRYAAPLADLSGTISEHFGEAPYFGFVTLQPATGTIEEQHVRPNPVRSAERAKGIQVAQWLLSEKVDGVFVHKNLEGKGPGYVFGEAGIDMRLTELGTLADVVAAELGRRGA